MTQAAAQASAFYKEVAETKKVWTIKDANGFPAPMTLEGRRSMPFWSSRSRAEKVIASVPAYAYFEPQELSWSEFVTKWIPGLKKDNTLVGVNWSGDKALGYDLEPEELQRNVEQYLNKEN